MGAATSAWAGWGEVNVEILGCLLSSSPPNLVGGVIGGVFRSTADVVDELVTSTVVLRSGLTATSAGSSRGRDAFANPLDSIEGSTERLLITLRLPITRGSCLTLVCLIVRWVVN